MAAFWNEKETEHSMKNDKIHGRFWVIAALILMLSSTAACNRNTDEVVTQPSFSLSPEMPTATIVTTPPVQEEATADISESTASPEVNDNEVTEIAVETTPSASSSVIETEAPSSPEEETKEEQLKWETFYAMSAEEKDQYLQSFSDYKDFVSWMNEAQEVFRQEHPDIVIGADGSFNLEDLLK